MECTLDMHTIFADSLRAGACGVENLKCLWKVADKCRELGAAQGIDTRGEAHAFYAERRGSVQHVVARHGVVGVYHAGGLPVRTGEGRQVDHRLTTAERFGQGVKVVEIDEEELHTAGIRCVRVRSVRFLWRHPVKITNGMASF